MSISTKEPIQAHIVGDNQEPSEAISIEELRTKYNNTKHSSSKAVSSLTDSFTLKGMDSINELVSDAMKQIKDSVNNGKKQTIADKATSRALSIVDPNNKWVGKWMDNASDELDKEKLQEKTINEIVDILISQIEQQRQEVIEFIQAAAVVKEDMIEKEKEYQLIKKHATLILDKAPENSMEYFDSQRLLTMVLATIEDINIDINSHVNPLIASANMSVREIEHLLPNLENRLKYKTGFKVFQQKLTDLNSITKAALDMTTEASAIISEEINTTIYESLEIMSETGMDVEQTRRIHEKEAQHQAKINQVMEKTQAKINKDFQNMNQLSLEMTQNREETVNQLLENYSNVSTAS